MFICQKVCDQCVTEVGVTWSNRQHRGAGPRTEDSVSGGVRLGPLHFGVGVVDWFGGEVL